MDSALEQDANGLNFVTLRLGDQSAKVRNARMERLHETAAINLFLVSSLMIVCMYDEQATPVYLCYNLQSL